jgi:hypothetical protein
MTNTLVTFDGLMIFHKDTSGFYEVGILNAALLGGHIPKHEFQINITPDPRTGTGSLRLGPTDLAPFLLLNKPWPLEVRDTNGNLQAGVNVDESLPDRKKKDKKDNRLGWIVNIESSEFHNSTLDRESNVFSPIIHLLKGNLFTFCKTGRLKKKKHKLVIEPDFGYLAGLLALDIDTSAGQTVTMKEEGGGVVFKLPAGTSYRVDITNDNVTPSTASHFHAYYETIFTGVAPRDWFDFEAKLPVDPSPDECPKSESSKPGKDGIPPYKCGGLLINAGGKPLS